MRAVALIFLAVAGLEHVLIFAMESLLFDRERVWRRFGVRSQADAALMRPWALNQGFYNLFLALAALGGVILVLSGRGRIGWSLAAYAGASMVAAAAVLLASDRSMARAALTQAAPAVVGLAAAALALGS